MYNIVNTSITNRPVYVTSLGWTQAEWLNNDTVQQAAREAASTFLSSYSKQSTIFEATAKYQL